MPRLQIIVVFLIFALVGCSTPPTPEALISGVWKNDAEKLDYHFGPEDALEVVGADGSVHSLPCTFSIQENENLNDWTASVWFNCPQSDWPGYAELHEFIFSEDYKSFTDTMYIQGIPSKRYEGSFVRATP